MQIAQIVLKVENSLNNLLKSIEKKKNNVVELKKYKLKHATDH